MYSALERIAGRQYCSANSSLASTTTASTAPQSTARCRTTSMSSPPCPRSMATATTSRPVSLAIQLIATEVSRPPEYARMTRSDIVKLLRVCSTSGSGQVLDRGGEFGTGHRFTGDHQDGVVTGYGADHVRQRPTVDGAGQVVRGAGRGAQHGEVAARVGGHQQV